ncbi:hypothetical protein BB427_11335 [Pseudoalteromonas sp. BMB]|uniref:hypothetical protein n=1 Tax=Pseudoalteromonas sp. BMB TaxID=1874619 RepID=UPI00083D26F9|nr:hypothetical protein [Pseudoalteromonas sp. BMB]ODB41077.1 hypothetical protein BB427_11335 [Pseudoalteromonas sp. BMB]
MSFQDAQGIIDSLKERISNPFMFTYSWLFIVCNWKAVGWFLFEPLTFSLKLQRFEYTGLEVYLLKPLMFTFLFLLIAHALNNFAEICKRFWDYLYAKFLMYIGWKEFVDKATYNKLHDEKMKLEDENRQLALDARTAHDSEQANLEKVSELSMQVGQYKEESKENQAKLTISESKIAKLTTQLEKYEKSEVPTKPTKTQEETNLSSFSDALGKLFFGNIGYEPEDTINVYRNKVHEFSLHNQFLDHDQQVLVLLYDHSRDEDEPAFVRNLYGSKDIIDEQLQFKLPVEVEDYTLIIQLIEPSAASGQDIPIFSNYYYLKTSLQ